MKAQRPTDFLLNRQKSSTTGFVTLQKQSTVGSSAFRRASLTHSYSTANDVDFESQRDNATASSASAEADLNTSGQSAGNVEISPVSRCIDYLTAHGKELRSKPELLSEFELMVVDMAHSMADPELNRILKEQAWTGARFRSSTLQNEFDVNSCLHALSNYYLKISNAAMLRSKIVRQASVASVSSAFNAAANDARILDQIRPYLPDLLVQYLKSNPIRKKEKDPRVISFASACMLADISGFSKFSGAMCSKGVSGLDELRETTSVFLGEFVKCVYEYGGDVIAFAGDALICVFPTEYGADGGIGAAGSAPDAFYLNGGANSFSALPGASKKVEIIARLESTEGEDDDPGNGDPSTAAMGDICNACPATPHAAASNGCEDRRPCGGGLSDGCFRAMQCGHLLRRKKTNKLSAHIGISYGEMKLALLGGHNDKWTYVLNGECVSELSSCIEDAPAQHLAVTPACFERALAWQQHLTSNTSSSSDCPYESQLIRVQEQKPSGNYLIESMLVRTAEGRVCSEEEELEDIQIAFNLQDSVDSFVGTPLGFEAMREPTPEPTPMTIDETLDMMSSPGGHFDEAHVSQSSSYTRGAYEGRQMFLSLPTQGLTPPAMDSPVLRPSSIKSSSPMLPIPFLSTQQSSTHFNFSHSSSQNCLNRRTSLLKSATTWGTARRGLRRQASHISAQRDKELIFSISPFVPRPVLNAIQSESLELVGELRQVTTLFLQLVSYSPTIHCDPLTLQPFFLIAQRVLHEAGGYLRQFLVDDKGCVLIAMWGVPSFAYSNNATRALYCATKLVPEVEELDHKCSIGITTGTAYCGSEGAPDRKDYAGIGSDVNMAARLMAKAHGRILVDERSRQNMSTEAQSLLSEGEEMHLKGMDGPTRPYVYSSPERTIPKILSADYTHGSDNSVLRKSVQNILDAELDKLCNADQMLEINEELLTGEAEVTSRFIFVMGMAGTGKSLAAAYYRSEARKRCVHCVYITALQDMKGVPYGVVRELLFELVGREHLTTNEQKEFFADALVDDICVACSERERRYARISLMEILGIDSEFESGVGSGGSGRGRNDGAGVGFADMSGIDDDDGDDDDDEEGENSSSNNNTSSCELRTVGDTSSRSRPVSTIFSGKRNAREFGDCTFHNVVGFLLANKPTVIIIENAHYADELSWDELRLLQVGTSLSISVMLTMQAAKAPKLRPISVMQVPGLETIIQKHEHGIVAVAMDEPFAAEPCSPSPFSTSSAAAEPHRRPTEIAALENHIKNAAVAELQGEEALADRRLEPATRSDGDHIFYSYLNPFARAAGTDQSSKTVIPADSFTQDDAAAVGGSSQDSPQPQEFSPLSQSSPSTFFAINNYISGSGSTSERYVMQSAPQSWFQMLSNENTIIVQLGELTRSEIRDELTRGLPFRSAAQPSDKLVTLVYEVSAGNAFWCQAIANFIKEKGASHFEEALSNFESREQALQQLVLIRFETNSVQLQLLLKYASIIGEEFNVCVLQAVLPKKFKAHVNRNLLLLVEKGFLRCVSEQPEAIYCFQHPAIRNCIYDLSTPKDKAGIHLAIAEYIENNFREQLRYYYPTLGLHYKRSGMKRASAFKFEIKAADQAVCGGAFFDGLAFLRSSAELAKRRAELRLVIEVADRAAEDIEVFRRIAQESNGHGGGKGFSLSRKSESFIGESAVLNSYTAVRVEAAKQLQRLEEERRQKNDDARRAMMKVRASSRGLTWQLSYVAGHRPTGRPLSVANAHTNRRHSIFTRSFFTSQKERPTRPASTGSAFHGFFSSSSSNGSGNARARSSSPHAGAGSSSPHAGARSSSPCAGAEASTGAGDEHEASRRTLALFEIDEGEDEDEKEAADGDEAMGEGVATPLSHHSSSRGGDVGRCDACAPGCTVS